MCSDVSQLSLLRAGRDPPNVAGAGPDFAVAALDGMQQLVLPGAVAEQHLVNGNNACAWPQCKPK
eukprot:CAMPEP_0202814384 /NCGR_PEP_ID=MMETSP1389-20130828/5523_1 /ASSEMBLY_ACC=CAM_ASM_000865 /TAXON_ID=302021 /ORGANISM="Rhodomonas sp., Strain CCMP768" /LENGTH=64 /DNA_ID=CAMNT_0049486145 /DNA_START=218 /DNA_END=413 /DNA_ORIENTATION=+